MFLGDVEISGTLNGGKPLNASNGADNRIGVFLDNDTIEGSDNFTYSDGVSFFVTASSAVGLGGAGKVQLESRHTGHSGSANVATAEDIRLLHVSGAVSSSLALGTSGINLKVADEKSIKIGNIAQDAYFEVAASATAGSEDLRVVNTNGTDEAAIAITATAGGVDVDAAAGKDVNVAGGQVALVSKDDAASAISLTANIGSSETIVVTNTQGTTDGSDDAGAIELSAAAGGIGLAWADDKSLWAEGGDLVFVANENPSSSAAPVIKLHADAGANQQIQLLNDEGTDEGAVSITATAGGVDIDAAAAKNVDIAGGQVLLSSKDNAASAIALTANQGSSETIVVTNTQGEGAGAIALTATAGGVDIDAAAAKDVDISGGQVLVSSKDNAASAIALTANVGSSETIVVTNTQGTSTSAIELTATAGGVSIDSANDSNITVTGSAKDLDIAVAGGGTQELRLASAGTGASALHLNASAGSVDIDSADAITVDAADEIVVTTTSEDGHISLVSAHTSGVAFHIDANADAASEVQIDAGILDIDITGAGTIDAGTGLSLDAGAASNFTTSAGALTLKGGAGESIGTLDLTSAFAGKVTVAQDLVVAGNVEFNGSVTSVDATNLEVSDRLIGLNYVSGSGEASLNDAGFIIGNSGGNQKAFFWDNDQGQFAFAETTSTTTSSTVTVGADDYAALRISSLTGSTVTLAGLTDNRVVIAGASGLLEDDANFTFDGSDLQLANNIGLVFSTDDAEKIESDGDDLTISSGGKINLTATSDVILPDNIGMLFGDVSSGGEKIEGDGSGLTVSGGTLTLDSEGDIILDADDADVVLKDGGTTIGGFGFTGQNLIVSSSVADKDIIFSVVSGSGRTEVARFDASGDQGQPSFLMATSRRLQFSDADEAIYSDGTDLHIEVGSNGDINIPANIGLVFDGGSNDEKIESDGTDLTISAGADINLTATSDVNIPASVGLTFGDDGEKIEGDGTDLTVVSSGKLNLNTSGTANIRLAPGGGKVLPNTNNNVSLGGNNTSTIVSSLDVKSGQGTLDSTTSIVRLQSLGDATSAQANDTVTIGSFSATLTGTGSTSITVSSASVTDASFPLNSTSTLVRFGSLPSGAIAGDTIVVGSFSASLQEAPSATKSVVSSFGSSLSMSGITVDTSTKIIRASSVGSFEGVRSGDSITIGSASGTTGDADGTSSTSLASASTTVTFASSFGSSITGTNEGSLSGITFGSTTTSITFTSESQLQSSLGKDIRQDDVVVIGSASFTISSNYSSGNSIAVSHTSGTQAGSTFSGGDTATITTAGNSNSPGGIKVTISTGSQGSISGGTTTSITTIGAGISSNSGSQSSSTGSANITTTGIEVTSATGSSSSPSTESTRTITRAETRYFSDLFLGDGAVINFNNGNYTITHSSGVATFSGQITTGGNILPSSDNALDLGSESARFRNIFTGDLSLRNDRGDWTLIEEEDFISFRNNKTGRRFRMIMEDITGLGNYGPGNDGEM